MGCLSKALFAKKGSFGILCQGMVFLCLSISMNLYADETLSEYDVKAALLVNFLRFVDWPPDYDTNKNMITIGIVGQHPAVRFFDMVIEEPFRGKRLRVKSLHRYKDMSELNDCELIFIDSSHEGEITEILKYLRGKPVLTVSEVQGFLEKGGMVNFILVDSQINFEISQYSANLVGLRIPSQILRRAHKVIQK